MVNIKYYCSTSSVRVDVAGSILRKALRLILQYDTNYSNYYHDGIQREKKMLNPSRDKMQRAYRCGGKGGGGGCLCGPGSELRLRREGAGEIRAKLIIPAQYKKKRRRRAFVQGEFFYRYCSVLASDALFSNV